MSKKKARLVVINLQIILFKIHTFGADIIVPIYLLPNLKIKI